MTLELVYFDIPGKGEPIRLACAYAGIELKDTRIDRATLSALKEDGTLRYGQVPALIVDGGKAVINQSNAILRYLGRVPSMDKIYPSDPLAASLVDSILDAEADMFAGLSCSKYKARFGYSILEDRSDSEELLGEVRKSLNNEVLPRHLGNLEKLAENSTTGWIANTANPSIADFVLVPRLQWLAGFGEGISEDILKPFTKLTGIMDRLMALPEVVAYYEK
jgi:glutathione S-transferase